MNGSVQDNGRRDGVDAFSVEPFTRVVSGAAERCAGALRRLGDAETRMLEDRLGSIRRPVYVCGLARSGSTVLLELLDWQPAAVTHRYRDFPLLHIPVLWSRFLNHAGSRAGAPRQRAHQDGIEIDRDSPEAFEEVLWMAFFAHLHDPTRSNVLDGGRRNADFDRFYRDHIRKLLWLRGGTRYVAKGNYNVTRLEYLLRLFPDARFVVPVRDPLWHVASLVKQQALFDRALTDNPAAIAHLRRAGHFEFGPIRTPIHSGDALAVERVLGCWRGGREAEGWARYWSAIYDHVLDRLDANPDLAAATLVLPYEALCATPDRAAGLLYEHCGFDPLPALVERAERRLHRPTYYQPAFSTAERGVIAARTHHTARRVAAHVANATPDLMERVIEVSDNTF